ncbi:MAG: DIP1984 family protein [Oscillospiraceae bacterium]|nr:DIP1984 family protein [Oscillospiraceae bacterium]
MKLAEALQERADLNRRIEQLRARINQNVLVQEGEKPNEDPAALIAEMDGAVDRLEQLMAAINRTNSATVVDGRTLTQIIAKKDALKLRLSAYRDLLYSASQNTHRARSTEIRILSAVPVAELQKKADDMSRDLRELENLLQSSNWVTDLLED